MTEDDASMSQQPLENQTIMDFSANHTTDSPDAQPSTLDGHPPHRTDQMRKEFSRLSHQELVNAHAKNMLDREIEQMESLTLFNALEQSRQKVSDLEKRLADQESVVRKAQESAFTLMASNTSLAENDDKICSTLRVIRKQWRNFAKKWASMSMADIRVKKHHLIKKLVDAFVAPDEDHSHDGIWAVENNRKAPSILLNTVLAQFICENIIRLPFTAAFNLEERAETDLCDDTTIMSRLEDLYAIKMKEDQRAAHQWRSQTVIFLNMQEPGSTIESWASQQALNRRFEYYEKLADAFECSDARLLYLKCSDEDKAARFKHLMDLFCLAGEFFSRLWSQKVYISTPGSSTLLKKPFDIGMEYCEPHAAHKLEENDNSKDGMPIQMIVEPGIFAYGNQQDESYDVAKVWGKAVVWLSSGGDGSNTSTSGAA